VFAAVFCRQHDTGQSPAPMAYALDVTTPAAFILSAALVVDAGPKTGLTAKSIRLGAYPERS
jgi:hypothetical protein